MVTCKNGDNFRNDCSGMHTQPAFTNEELVDYFTLRRQYKCTNLKIFQPQLKLAPRITIISNVKK